MPNHSQPPFPQSQRPAASNRANPRGTHRGPSTTQGLPPSSPPHHRHFPPSAAALYQAPENGMVPRASRARRPRLCPEVVQPNEWGYPQRRRASCPRPSWPRTHGLSLVAWARSLRVSNVFGDYISFRRWEKAWRPTTASPLSPNHSAPWHPTGQIPEEPTETHQPRRDFTRAVHRITGTWASNVRRSIMMCAFSSRRHLTPVI